MIRKIRENDIVSLYRTRLSKEKGSIFKQRAGRLSIALIYPNTYRLGMSNLGFQIVYQMMNRRHDVVAERVFLPEGNEMSLYRRAGKPLLSLETQSPLHQFDLIAFSISFENDYQNILKILELGKIPLLAEKRRYPLPFVMAGGITTFLNPEPLTAFFDFFLLGEAESNLNELLTFFVHNAEYRGDKGRFLKGLAANICGLYVPSLYGLTFKDDGTIKSFQPRVKEAPEKIKVPVASPLKPPVNTSAVLTPDTEFADKALVELGRGCGRACRFCAAGYVYRPPRFHQVTDLEECINRILQTNGQVGLMAPAVMDVPGIENLTRLLVDKKSRFSVSSLRAENITHAILKHLKQTGQKTVAIAPEAGSERLRRVINKHLKKNQIMDTVGLIAKTASFSIRLYFLIGLPTEEKGDIDEMINLVKGVKHIMIKQSAARGTIGRIKLSVNCFIPKPFTPLQWAPLDFLPSLKEKQRVIKRALSKAGGIKVNSDLPKWAYIQTLLSVGDRRVSAMLLKCHQYGGDWNKALRFSEVNPDFFVYRPKDLNEIFPWDFIDNGVKKGFLAREYEKALTATESDICRIGDCYRCGVCTEGNRQ